MASDENVGYGTLLSDAPYDTQDSKNKRWPVMTSEAKL